MTSVANAFKLILAIDPKGFGDPEGNLDHGERLCKALLAQDGGRLPGDRRIAQRVQAQEEGRSVSDELYQRLLGYCEQ